MDWVAGGGLPSIGKLEFSCPFARMGRGRLYPAYNQRTVERSEGAFHDVAIDSIHDDTSWNWDAVLFL